MIVNIPGTDVAAGQEQFGYIGSGPPKGSGRSRFMESKKYEILILN